jgi:hypothetical protein
MQKTDCSPLGQVAAAANKSAMTDTPSVGLQDNPPDFLPHGYHLNNSGEFLEKVNVLISEHGGICTFTATY